jgi:hypothetical protein
VTERTGLEVSADEFHELFERVSNWGALGLLGTNVAKMVAGASATLVVQRRLRRRAGARA